MIENSDRNGMTAADAIYARRSIRKFKPDPLTKEQVETVLNAACAAPSAKNRQPWKFIVLMDEEEREKVFDIMERGIDRSEHVAFPGLRSSARNTLSVMRSAPVTVLVFSPDISDVGASRTVLESLFDIALVQSVGASIQNMLLSATKIGLGSLWICDVFYAYEELTEYFGRENGLMAAAVSLGIPDEAPRMRPRKKIEEVTEWR